MKNIFFKMDKCTIPVVFDGRIRHVKNVSRYATSRDVMHKLLIELHLGSKADDFRIFEVVIANGLERMLQNKDRIVKIRRSWGVERHNFQFIMKRYKANFYYCPTPASPIYVEQADDMDATGILPSDAVRGVIPITDRQTRVTAYLSQRNLMRSGNENRLGKLSVLRRFFTDIPFKNTTKPTTGSLPATGFVEVVSDSDVAMKDKTAGRDVQSDTDESAHSLDVAFVKSYQDMYVDEGIELESGTSGSMDLNTAFIGNDDTSTYECVATDTSAEQVWRVLEASDESRCDFVRTLFCGKRRFSEISQDSELESFMKTRIYDTDTDEGVSSSGSDVNGRETCV